MNIEKQSSSSFGNPIKKIFRYFLYLGFIPGFWIFSSYLATFIGEGFKLLVLAFGLFLLFPIISVYFLVKDTRHPIGISLLINGALFWILSFVLISAAWRKTNKVLSKHGMWAVSFVSKEKRKKSDTILKKVIKKFDSEDEIPFSYKNGSIIVDTYVFHNHQKVKLSYILDTGASITTISSKQVSKLGLQVYVPVNNSIVKTAGGIRKYPIVLLNEIQLGKFKEGPLVALICDDCAQNGNSGLLGLNFTSRFHIVIDNNNAKIHLKKQNKWFDNKNEIELFLKIDEVKVEQIKEHFKFSAKITNTAPVSVYGMIFKCIISDKNGNLIDKKKYRLKKLDSSKSIEISVTSYQKKLFSFQWELERAFWKQKKL